MLYYWQLLCQGFNKDYIAALFLTTYGYPTHWLPMFTLPYYLLDKMPCLSSTYCYYCIPVASSTIIYTY